MIKIFYPSPLPLSAIAPCFALPPASMQSSHKERGDLIIFKKLLELIFFKFKFLIFKNSNLPPPP
jgi:hypothetical protein